MKQTRASGFVEMYGCVQACGSRNEQPAGCYAKIIIIIVILPITPDGLLASWSQASLSIRMTQLAHGNDKHSAGPLQHTVQRPDFTHEGHWGSHLAAASAQSRP